MRRVKNKETDKMGFVVADSFGCCDSSEDLVVYDGTNTGFGTDKALLETIKYETPTPEPTKCGAGMGVDCCIFLTVGSDGFVCERFNSLRDTLIFRTMKAQRNPEEVYPLCMKL